MGRINMVAFLQKFVEEESHKAIMKETKRYEKACKQATKEIRERVIEDWFGEYNADKAKSSSVYRPYIKAQDNKKVIISVNTYNDADLYPLIPDAEAWLSRNDVSPQWSSNIYVLEKLQMDKGIIGLPERSVYFPEKNWKNANFIQRDETLRKAILNSSLWDSFEERVKSKV